MGAVLSALARHRRPLLGVAAALLCIGLAAWGANAWLVAQRHQAAIDAIIEQVALPKDASFAGVTNAVRAFVNDHSRHKIDAEFYADWPHPYVMAEKVVAHAKGLRAERPHFECSTRTRLMRAVLERLGIETRRIDIYDAGTLRSHTFLEAFDSQSRRWETQDPDYDISWRDVRTQARVSIAAATGDLDAVEPCGRTACGWSVESREGIKAGALRGYFDFIVVRETDSGRRYTIHTPRAAPDKAYEHRGKTGQFCEVMEKNCRDGFFPIGSVPQALAKAAQ